MKQIIAIVFIIVSICSLAGYEPHFLTDPAISPDGTQICFVYNGDIWSMPFSGGIAKRLTSTAAYEYGLCWSPDGKSIAFTSNREGQYISYIMPAPGGEAKPVSKESMTVCDWFPDGNALLCSKSSLDWGTSLYEAPLSGKRPQLIAEIGDYFSSLSPAGDKIIFNRYGDAYRESFKGSTNGDLWLYDLTTKKYNRLTDTEYTERYPVFSKVSGAVYYCASDGTCFQLFKSDDANLTNPLQLTSFSTWSVRDVDIARFNDRMVFEVFDSIWCYDPGRPDSLKVFQPEIVINEDDWKSFDTVESVSDTYDDFAISEDELLLAFTYKYDLFVMPRKGGEVKQITDSHSGAQNPAFLSDNRTVVFIQNDEGIPKLFKTKIDSVFTVESVFWYGADRFYVDRFYKSSEHHWVIEYTDSLGGGRIAVADRNFDNIKPVLTDKVIGTSLAISPDGNMAVFATIRDDVRIREIYLYDFISGSRRLIQNEDAWIYNFTWLPDQKSILFGKSDDGYHICRMDLIPRDEFELEKDNWKEILSLSKADSLNTKRKTKSEIAAPLAYSKIDWDLIEYRIKSIVADQDFIYPVQAIDDTSFYYVKETRGKDSKSLLNKINIDGKNQTEVGSFPLALDYQIVNDQSIYFKESKKLRVQPLKSKTKTDINNQFVYTYNRRILNQKVFEQVWGIFGKNFYDPYMHNKNWYALKNRFKPYLSYVDDSRDLELVVEEMIGEINASHTGFTIRSESEVRSKPSAWLGMVLDYSSSMQSGVRVSEIYPGTALYNYHSIRSGDILKSINGTNITPYTSIDSLLADQTGKTIELGFLSNGVAKKLSVKGLSWSENRELWFRNKVEQRRSKTNQYSSNRIGYVLIPRMSGSEYRNFISEVFTRNADKEALIIDIRGNVGGRIHNDLLNFLSQKPNAYTTSRRFGSEMSLTPGRTWTKPVALLIDEHSFSDAEIFPQLFKEAKLGTVIGMPTSGSVIGTWEIQLMDGSSMRMPGSGWYRLDGTNMEGNGAQPDIRVEMDLNDIIADNDIQLKKAVEVLLDQLK